MSSDLILTPEDGGREVPVTPGASVELRLPENPTTGFRWTVEGDVAVSHDGYDGSAPEPGAATTRVLRLTMPDRAMRLRLRRRQDWDPEGADGTLEFDLRPRR
ncbi:MAG: protease inhibitor I42 family protein [Jannaschia sp.]